MIEEQVTFLSEGLKLEGRLAYDEDAVVPQGRVLLCPPHPFLGGDMENNVLNSLVDTLATHDFAVFRFNYRGIGASETDRDLQEDQKQFWEASTCPEYEARIFRDCAAALQTLEEIIGRQSPLCIVGYSFGCLPAIQLLAEHDIHRLGLVSPPLTKWKLAAASLQVRVPKKLFFSTDDFACPEEDVRQLHDAMAEPKELQAFRDADHFFIGQEAELATAVKDFLVRELH